ENRHGIAVTVELMHHHYAIGLCPCTLCAYGGIVAVVFVNSNYVQIGVCPKIAGALLHTERNGIVVDAPFKVITFIPSCGDGTTDEQQDNDADGFHCVHWRYLFSKQLFPESF